MTITSYPVASPVPFDLLVSLGKITGYRAWRLNAYNLSAGTSRTTVWPKNVNYVFPVSATTMKLYSTVVGDTTQTVLIQGLDASYNEIQETKVLNGQAGVTTTNSYLRINKMQVVLGNPTGDISLGTGAASGGVPAVTYGFILAGDGITLSAVYTIPAGYTLAITANTAVTGALSSTQTMIIGFRAITLAGTSLLLNKLIQGNASVILDGDPMISIPEKTDITANSQTSGGTATISMLVSAFLVKN